jgi:biotin carboxylase/acetyl-CoA carboxylase carboxyltransferase component/biotin carboxyl carrier protein
MTTPEDLRANAEYVRMADEFIEVPGGSNNNNFANVRLICELAETCRADAVWAGWGHASENPALPDGLKDRGIAFVGPPSGPMHALGDKIGSTLIAQSADVPTIAWNGAGIRIDYKTDGLSPEVYEKANVKSVGDALRLAPDVGFPLMVKASEGGGGKGIRKVMTLEALADSFRQVQGEVPGSPIFLMRLAPKARHLEVQLLADEYGQAISLSGRDCSVQRRHQKIVEEGPPVAADPPVWKEMERAAVRLAKEVGYINAGTVEYLYMEDPPEGFTTKFAFLELNPRLQVEHPVTEMITGVNLPASQLQVAMGIPLHRIAEIRRLYGRSSTTSDPIDFDTAEQRPPLGHVIAARITAENPDTGFQPTSGAVTELNFRSTPNVWGYFSVDSSGRVHEFADSQIGHLFGFGPSREAARRNMVLALRELSIRGEIRTTVEYLAHMMESSDFRSNQIHTQWLDRRITEHVGVGKPPTSFVALIGGVVRCHETVSSRASEFCSQLERGQCPSKALLSVEHEARLVYEGVRYTMQTARASENHVVVSCNGVYVMVEARALPDGGLLVLVGGRSHVVYWKDEATGLRINVDGTTCIFSAESDPSKLRAEVSGKLVRYLVEDGSHVDKGQGYAEIEVMKMYMPVLSPEAGVIHHVQPEGSILEAGSLIARMDLDDPSRVFKAEEFTGTLVDAVLGSSVGKASDEAASTVARAASPDPAVSTTPLSARRAHVVTRSTEKTLRSVMAGFVVPREVFDAALTDFDRAWQNGHLPLLELEELMSVLASRLPSVLVDGITRAIDAHRVSIGERRTSRVVEDLSFPDLAVPGADESDALLPEEMSLAPIEAILDQTVEETPAGRERTTLQATAKPIRELCSKFSRGVRGARRSALCSLLAEYVDVEKLFGGGAEGRRREDVLMDLRSSAMSSKDALLAVYRQVRAHEHSAERNVLVLCLLRRIAAEIEQSKATVGGAGDTPESDVRRTPARDSPMVGLPDDSGSIGMALSADGEQIETVLSFADSISDAGRSDADSGNGSTPRPPPAGGGSAQPPLLQGGDWDREESLLFALAELRGADFAEVALEARQMLIVARQPSVRQRLATIEQALRQIAKDTDRREPRPSAGVDVMSVQRERTVAEAPPPKAFAAPRHPGSSRVSPHVQALVRAELPLNDVLMHFFGAVDTGLRKAAVEVHVRRLYRAYSIRSLLFDPSMEARGVLAALFKFSSAPSSSSSSAPEHSAKSGGMHKTASLGGGNSSLLYAAGAADSVDNLHALAARDASPDEDEGLALPAADGGFAPVSVALVRVGIFAVFSTIDELLHKGGMLGTALTNQAPSSGVERVNVVHLVVLQRPTGHDGSELADDAVVSRLSSSLEVHAEALRKADVRRVTVLTPPDTLSIAAQRSGSSFLTAHEVSTGVRLAQSADSPLAHLASPSDLPRSVVPLPRLTRTHSAIMLGAKDDRGVSREAPAPLTEMFLAPNLAHPCAFSFRERHGFSEDARIRHIEPPLSGYLELGRLSAFKVRFVPTPNRAVHVYEAQPATGGPSSRLGVARKRFFVRAIVRHTERLPTLDSVLEQFPGPERMFVEALNALGVAMGDVARSSAESMAVGNNHVFLNVLPTASVHPEYVVAVIRTLARRYADRLRVLRVAHVEFRILTRLRPGAPPLALRLLCSNPTGYVLRVDAYVEVRDDSRRDTEPILVSIPTTGPDSVIMAAAAVGFDVYSADVRDVEAARAVVAASGAAAIRAGSGSALWPVASGGGLAAIRAATESLGKTSVTTGSDSSAPVGELDGKPVSTPYPVTTTFERRRALAAHTSETLFAYDFLELLQRALEIEWDTYNRQAARAAASERGSGAAAVRRPRQLLVARELILRPKSKPTKVLPSPQGSPLRPLGKGFEMSSNELGGAPSKKLGPDATDLDFDRSILGMVSSDSALAMAAAAAGGRSVAASTDVSSWEIEETNRLPGQNDIAMVAWRVTIYTPECPEEVGGRNLVIIANDITVSAGSFGVKEDALFYHASRLARAEGIPRIFLAANSGARIGLAEEVKRKFQVAWQRPEDPTKGFKYLYLTPEDYATLVPDPSVPHPCVKCSRVVDEGETRFVLDDVIGQEDDLGVENLRGSGMIAGETSRSYRENFTLTYVTGRSVGIGAYLVRLGQRTIQKRTSAPILLTGFQALNKLVGAEVYTSNEQLGGPKIMFHNGVTHQVVEDDLHGVIALVRWLSYVPRARGAALPISPGTASLDPVDRPIGFVPPGTPYDPRHLLAGLRTVVPDEDKKKGAGTAPWVSGFFDRGSWTEYLSGWARTVVVGRARLGGLPMGVIIAETRTVTQTRPADPATPQSQETTVQQAGQVWFPDSAFKTAQAVRDFAGEDLPLMIFANWRGFSGGQRDMFDEVLKFGSYIVDALTEYRQPVFVYIPPGGELRGGAWVVVDPSINEDVMEMYCDPQGRGGVLEPAGIASIKFKHADLRDVAMRLDPTLKALVSTSRACRAAGDEKGAKRAEADMEERMRRLVNVYTQISHHFADLHDRPGRMVAKGAIRAPVAWERARTFFYWRLRRRLAEFALRKRIVEAAPQVSFAESGTLLEGWFRMSMPTRGGFGAWEEDVRVLQWLADYREVLETHVASLRRESISERVLSLGLRDPGAAIDGILALINRLNLDQREAIVGRLRREVLFGPVPGTTSVFTPVDPLLAGLPPTRE